MADYDAHILCPTMPRLHLIITSRMHHAVAACRVSCSDVQRDVLRRSLALLPSLEESLLVQCIDSRCDDRVVVIGTYARLLPLLVL